VDEHTSAGAALILYKSGYTDVYALLGGLVAWEVAGYPVESP
jgi:rhodanese-related sulfurtransferase